MKTKATSQAAFFNLRVVIGVFIFLTGVFLTLASFGAFSVQVLPNQKIIINSTDPLVPNGFDCSKIQQLSIDRQENFRAQAIMIACGQAQGGSASPMGKFFYAIQQLLSPLAYGTTDVDLVTGTETSLNVTQSETFTAGNPDDPNQIVVAYNDSRGRNANPINISGASVSTDGGATFTRLTKTTGQGPFENTVGDPVVLYNKPTGNWFTVWLDSGCGGQGLGGYKSTTPWDANSWTHYCIHSNSQDDRESGWADNNPSSPFYGRMYVSWNDYNVGGGALFATYSSDNGATWQTPINVFPSFVRNVQITGDLATGDVYIAGMDEGGGGFPHNDTNLFYRSTDGGNTWTNTYTGRKFPGPGVTAVGYFACMFTDGGGYWRHEGWGEPAAYNGVVHYVYSQHGNHSDAGDVYYIRSTDKGQTFSAPLKLNTDATTRPQWQPNLSVSQDGTVFATWYDGRESAGCTSGNPAVPCYRMWARKSTDNGVTWLADMQFSDVVSPLPAQPDPGIQATYAGDYDYGSSLLTQHLSAWCDGRVAINGTSQQDAFHDTEPASPGGSPTPTPTAMPTATATATATVPPNPTPSPTAAPTPAAPTALNATNVTASSFTANWSSVTGATGYLLDVSTSSSFVTYVQPYQNWDVGIVTSQNVTGLTQNTNYYYRLRAYNGNGTSPNSNVIKVKTRSH